MTHPFVFSLIRDDVSTTSPKDKQLGLLYNSEAVTPIMAYTGTETFPSELLDCDDFETCVYDLAGLIGLPPGKNIYHMFKFVIPDGTRVSKQIELYDTRGELYRQILGNNNNQLIMKVVSFQIDVIKRLRSDLSF